MRIAVIGAGGVGGYFGVQLAAAGHDVVFVARGRQLAALREGGLTVVSDDHPVRLTEVEATDDVRAIGDVDLVLIAVKLGETENVARQLAQLPTGPRAVLSLQNGVQKDELLRTHLPATEILGGVCYISAAIEAPGVIRHNGSLARIVVGTYGGPPSATVDALQQALGDAGVEVEVSDDIDAAVWRKFVFLVALSSATSAARQPIGVLRANDSTRRLLRDLMEETVAVARARGVVLPADYVDRQMDFIDTLPEQMGSSMHYDLTHGNALELPWLGGGVVTMGEAVGVPTPTCRALAAALSPYTQGGTPA
ncbi:MAG TPA: 2-dehydropantoate 2-reductase [Flexivirga sp.]|uniref:2-dehydropantoate 2-reductase n=1 Tax=Flexivirga sp. TaxID=1962927 RepID=UPI002BFB54CD|nr:2-dehydropantoate 2-reductase [Flexivirga sp.]HWC23149.1 2-dehydropantoate 2-reductase [Flexivirga sp.]